MPLQKARDSLALGGQGFGHWRIGALTVWSRRSSHTVNRLINSSQRQTTLLVQRSVSSFFRM